MTQNARGCYLKLSEIVSERRNCKISFGAANEGKRRVVYQLSYKAQRMLTTLYKKLEGEEIPESKSSNPMFLRNVSYTDKVYRNYIKKINKSIRQLRHPFQ